MAKIKPHGHLSLPHVTFREPTQVDNVISVRTLAYLLAPLPIVTCSIVLSRWAHDDPNKCATRNEVRMTSDSREAWRAPPARPWATDDLQNRCEILAKRVRAELNPEDAVIVQSPFVIAGNVTADELSRWHQGTIAPAMRAMQRDFFRAAPEHPITVLLFSDEPTYRTYASRLFDQRRVSIYGYYQPTSRTVVINLQAGGGTLVHELTHALVDFDFPDVPLWFNEGLASLNEHCDLVISDGEPTIRPLVNWRLETIQNAILEGRLPPTWELMHENQFRGRNEALLYAHARYFCYYLHEQGVLREFYTTFRSKHASGDQGELTARQFFPGKTWSQIERQFRTWVMQQRLQPRGDRPDVSALATD